MADDNYVRDDEDFDEEEIDETVSLTMNAFWRFRFRGIHAKAFN